MIIKNKGNDFSTGSDPLGGWNNILQSIVSIIGSGGLYGKGFIQGSQNQPKVLPRITLILFSHNCQEVVFFHVFAGVFAIYGVVFIADFQS